MDMEQPSLQLASRILQRLFEAGLIKLDQREKLLTRLASGRMDASDWRLIIERENEEATE